MKKGLLLHIFTNPTMRKCANGGITETHDRAIVVGDGIPEIFPANNMPVLVLKKNPFGGCAHLEPLVNDRESRWFMFGGAFGHTSDSRFRQAVESITGANYYGAVPIHDREEAA